MSRALLRHRHLLLAGARSAAAHPFAAAASRAASSHTARSVFPSSAAAAAAAASQASAGAGEQPLPPPAPAARGRWGLLKFGVFAAFAGAIGGVGYTTYAYSLQEVDEMTREFRKEFTKKQAATMPEDASAFEVTATLPEDASAFEKYKAMAYSKAMKGLY